MPRPAAMKHAQSARFTRRYRLKSARRDEADHGVDDDRAQHRAGKVLEQPGEEQHRQQHEDRVHQ